MGFCLNLQNVLDCSKVSHVSNSTPVDTGDQAGENAAVGAVHAKLLDQDKVQWLTDRLVTDLSRTRPDQNSPNTEKGRWVKKQLLSSIYFWCEICVREPEKMSHPLVIHC